MKSRRAWRLMTIVTVVMAVAFAARHASAYVLHRSEAGAPYSWRMPTVSVTAYPRTLTQMTLEEGGAAITKSVAAWSNQDPALASCSALDLVLTVAPESEDAPDAAYDNRNVIAVRTSNWEAICSTAPDGNLVCHQREELALTTIVATTSGKIFDVDVDVEVNAWDYQWADLDVTPASEALQDLQNALTHEMGHFVGFDHTCFLDLSGFPVDPNGNIILPRNSAGEAIPACPEASPAERASTMFPSSEAGDTSKRTLEPDDQAGICATYPLEHGCGACASVPGSAPGPGETGRLIGQDALFAVALALLARRRRSRRRATSPVPDARIA